jgi:hypothetical protein
VTALRFIWAFFTFAVYQVLMIPLNLLGFIVVPFAIWFGRVQPSVFGTPIFSAPRALWLWGNQQEGYDSDFAKALYPGWSTFWRRYSWAAWRNKTNNVRFVKFFHPPPDPKRIQFKVRKRWILCWQGPFYRFEYTWPSGALTTIGWRYKPSDIGGLAEDDWRRFGCGFGARPYIRKTW